MNNRSGSPELPLLAAEATLPLLAAEAWARCTTWSSQIFSLSVRGPAIAVLLMSQFGYLGIWDGSLKAWNTV